MIRRIGIPLVAGLAVISACAGPASSTSSAPGTSAASTAPTTTTPTAPPATSASAPPATTPTSTHPTTTTAGTTVGAHPKSPSCTAHVVVGESANGTTVCVLRGSDITVLLHATPGSGWSSPRKTGIALGAARPVPTPAGYVGWSFLAAATGTAEITTARPACPPASPGQMTCQSMIAYVLHVRVQ
jgi:hypothetical protein